MTRAISLVIILACTPATLGQDKKAPVPDAPALKEKEKVVRDLFKEEYKSRVSKDRVAFSENLLRQGAENKNDPEVRYIMLRDSMMIAGEEKEFYTAFSAVDKLTEFFEGIKGGELKLNILTKAKTSTKSPEDAGKLSNQYVALAQQCWTGNEYEIATRALIDAATVAKSAKDFALVTYISDLQKDTKEVKDAYDKVRQAEVILSINENDPEANAAYGWFLCLFKGESSKGIAMLAKGPTDKGAYTDFTSLAADELGAQKSKELYACGEKWNTIGLKSTSPVVRRNAQAHTRDLFERALKDAEGLDRAQIEKRLSDANKAASLPAIAGLGVISFQSPEQIKRFVFSGGNWRVENGELLGTTNDNQWATLKTSFSSITQVMFRARIVSPGKTNLRIWVGPIHLIFNWEGANQNHYRNGSALTTTSPHALTPDKEQEIVLRQDGKKVIVTIDGNKVYETDATLKGTISVQGSGGSTIGVRQLRFDGRPDSSKEVKAETRIHE